MIVTPSEILPPAIWRLPAELAVIAMLLSQIHAIRLIFPIVPVVIIAMFFVVVALVVVTIFGIQSHWD
jgi:hypothetical protein